MKDKIIDILTKSAIHVHLSEGQVLDVDIPKEDAERIADKIMKEVLEVGDVRFICDEKACEECGHDGDRDCFYTTDIRHARNFLEAAPGKFTELFVIPPLRVSLKDREIVNKLVDEGAFGRDHPIFRDEWENILKGKRNHD